MKKKNHKPKGRNRMMNPDDGSWKAAQRVHKTEKDYKKLSKKELNELLDEYNDFKESEDAEEEG